MYKNATLGSAKVLFLLSLFFVSFSTALTNVFAGLLLVAFVLAVLADRTLLRPMKLTAAVHRFVLLAGGVYAAARRPDAATIMQRPAST